MDTILAVGKMICLLVVAIVWMLIHVAVYHYIVGSVVLDLFSKVALFIGFLISATYGSLHIILKDRCSW